MKIINLSNIEEISESVSKLFVDEILSNPFSNLGLPTGRTFRPIYAKIIQKSKNLNLDTSNCTSFNIDEYSDLDTQHPDSFHSYMNTELFFGLKTQFKANYFPSKMTNYDQLIDSNGGIDLLFLGFGNNGHIGFNEPGTPFDSFTHEVKLTAETIKQNQKTFKGQFIPVKAMTMGLKTIFNAQKIVLVVSGVEKKKTFHDFLGSTSNNLMIPATVLKNHPNFTIFCDRSTLN